MGFCPQCGSPLTSRTVGGRERPACASPGCDYVFSDNPTPVVAGLVELNGQVVLVRSQGWPEKWHGIVAGFLERGETPETGVLREVREELGLEGEIAGFIGTYVFEEMNQLILAYHVKAEGEIVLGDELAEAKRVPPEKLRPWPVGTGPAVRDWLARRQGQAADTDVE